MGEAGLDDVFTDDITVPAADGYKLAATLFLPRGAKRHAVLINSATATPRKIYRGFAGYLAHRGCAVLTYDYRGIGGSRQRAVEGYNQPKSLTGFKAFVVANALSNLDAPKEIISPLVQHLPKLWELFHDSAHPTRFLESFMDESWIEHLRQHERVSVADREIQRRANQFLVKGESTKSTHWLADR